MRKFKLRFSVRSLLIVLVLFAVVFAWIVSLKNDRDEQTTTADFLDENFAYLLERDVDFKQRRFVVKDRDGQLLGNNLPVRNPKIHRNGWAEIVEPRYDHVYITDKTELSSKQLSSAFEKLPGLKSAMIHKELYNDAEITELREQFPDLEIYTATLLATE